MTTVAIVGAGAIARAYAALLARAGHAAALWSPSGAGTRDLRIASAHVAAWPDARAVTLTYSGAVEGTATVATLGGPADLAAAAAVIVALPAPAYANVLPTIAPHLRSGQTVFVTGALSLAPLWLAELAAAHGTRPVVAASGTTVATARTRDGGVTVMTIRTRLGAAALPISETRHALALCTALFGDRFDAADSLLAVTLTNINPVAHAAMALANFTRIERGEAWPQYHYLTPAVARLIETMDAERRAIAAAFGVARHDDRGAFPAVVRRTASHTCGNRRRIAPATRRSARPDVARHAVRPRRRSLRTRVQRRVGAHCRRVRPGHRGRDHDTFDALWPRFSSGKSA